MDDFYDLIAPYYHYIHSDWDAHIEQQATFLSKIIREQWGEAARSILDVSCGIGTQSIGFALLGYQVTASDLSAGNIERARAEAGQRGLSIPFSVCDMRDCHDHHGGGYDVVISAGNAVPHLLDDDEILTALRQMLACLRPGGGCLITMRQYDHAPRGTNLFHPFGVREEDGRRIIIFQIWDFDGPIYDLAMYFIDEDIANGEFTVNVARSRYYAISPDHLATLMAQAGFTNVQRLDDGQNHPAIIAGTRPS